MEGVKEYIILGFKHSEKKVQTKAEYVLKVIILHSTWNVNPAPAIRRI